MQTYLIFSACDQYRTDSLSAGRFRHREEFDMKHGPEMTPDNAPRIGEGFAMDSDMNR